jgi:TM2 domain-containing membrane protein YozV
MNQRLFQLLPELEPEEMNFVSGLVNNFTDQQLMYFANIYRSRRRDPQIILLTALAGFVGVAGIHRFLTNNIGLGILYLLTGGLCLIGTIVDLINHRQIAFDYNMQTANEVSVMISRMQTN